MGKELISHFEKLPGVDILPFYQDEEIAAQGNPARNLFIVEFGHILSFRVNPEGQTAAYLPSGPNSILGTEIMADGHQSQDYEKTLVGLDNGQALRIPKSIFKEVLQKNPQAAILVLDQIIKQLAKADRQRSWLKKPGKERVALTLLEFHRQLDGTPINVTEERIRGVVKLNRETTSRKIAWLKRIGVLATGRKKRAIHIINPQLLEQTAKGHLKLI